MHRQIDIYLPIVRLPCRPMELELQPPGTVEHPPLDFLPGPQVSAAVGLALMETQRQK